jgi:hypothetical protein
VSKDKSLLSRENEELRRTAKLLISESRALIARTKDLTKKLAVMEQKIQKRRGK